MHGIASGTIGNQQCRRTHFGERARAMTGIICLVALALAITLAQTAAALVVSIVAGNGSPESAYRAFCRRDGFMYATILSSGYRSTIPPTASVDFDNSNVAFFPGYPLAARWLRNALGESISFRAAMVLTAQVAAWAFWTYWLLFLRRWGVPSRLAALATTILALHPAAFFLVVAYSEALFLAASLGFLYWVTSSTTMRWPLAAAHGFVMTATRLGGAPW
jgi:Gpi18-like mannosyltransferase